MLSWPSKDERFQNSSTFVIKAMPQMMSPVSKNVYIWCAHKLCENLQCFFITIAKIGSRLQASHQLISNNDIGLLLKRSCQLQSLIIVQSNICLWWPFVLNSAHSDFGRTLFIAGLFPDPLITNIRVRETHNSDLATVISKQSNIWIGNCVSFIQSFVFKKHSYFIFNENGNSHGSKVIIIGLGFWLNLKIMWRETYWSGAMTKLP